MFPRPHCVCVRVLCARTRCSVSVSVGGRTFFCCSDSERESSERHSLKTRNSDRVCVGVIHRRSVRRTPHSSLSVCVCVCVCLGPACFVFSSPQKKKTAARVFFSAAAAGERERASEVQLHYGCVCLIRQVLYSSAGCPLSLHHSEKPDHEEVCEFRPYTCPCPGATCKWHGSLEAVMPHLMHAHKSITTLQGEDIVFLATDINLPGAVDWVMMQSCFSHHFMLVLEKQEKYEGHQQFFAVVLLIGTRKQAENFAYRLELNGNRRRLTWEATPRSIHDGVAAAIMNSDCLVFDTSIAHLFADNGNLGINVTISMC
ncbi:E3 ubiquitin-protein ligase Siah2 isoform X2 [Maylandia zebra]|uniref:E3 ubiquitin-protein ligase Siah2 isoform X2 n=1 Tax=Maylandia zebra TaxID=106582 RepID=UPI00403C3D7E